MHLARDYRRELLQVVVIGDCHKGGGGAATGDCYRGLLQGLSQGGTATGDCYRGLLQGLSQGGTATGDCYRGLLHGTLQGTLKGTAGPSHPSVAVGYEEALGQRVGTHGLQEILQWHALAVHPEQHIKFHVIANSGTESTASCDMRSDSLLMVIVGYSTIRLQRAVLFT